MPESSGVGGGGFPGERADPGSWAPSLHLVKGLFYGKYPKGLFKEEYPYDNTKDDQRQIRDRQREPRWMKTSLKNKDAV